jgi:MFS family permease
MSLLSTTLRGIFVVPLATIAEGIGLEDSLRLWPGGVYSLASGSALISFRSLSDVVSSKASYIVGSFFFSAVWILAYGFSQTEIQLIVFRAIHRTVIAIFSPP